MTRSHRRIGVLVRGNPAASLEAKEAIRLCVGLLLRNSDVHLFLSGESLKPFESGEGESDREPEFLRHLRAFVEMGYTVVVEREALEALKGFASPLEVRVWSREEIIDFLTQCHELILATH